MAKKKITKKKSTKKETEYLKESLEALDSKIDSLNTLRDDMRRERKRIDRIVQVLLNNLPRRHLNKTVYFSGTDCSGRERDYEKMPLKSFLTNILDP